MQIEFIRKLKTFRKEARIKEILAERGDQPGLVHIFSATEACLSYQPWHDKSTHRTFLKLSSGKCLHYYFYFIGEQFGLCYVRVPTWAPFRLQVYFNGHSWLARQLRQAEIPFEVLDNAFLSIANPEKGQELADGRNAQTLHDGANGQADAHHNGLDRCDDGLDHRAGRVHDSIDAVLSMNPGADLPVPSGHRSPRWWAWT